MAYSDYRLCDACGCKAFYDANLNYEQGRDISGAVRNGGDLMQHTKLDYLGDWVVLCTDCAKTRKCVVLPIEEGTATVRSAAIDKAEGQP